MASIERQLAALDHMIEAARERLEEAYEVGLTERQREEAWAQFQRLTGERNHLLWEWSIREKQPDWHLFALAVEHAWRDLARKLSEAIQPHLDAWSSRLSEVAGLTTYVCKRMLREGEFARKPGPRQIFAPVAVGVGPIGRAEFRESRPANRRPVLPGYMIQKGRG